MTTWLHYWSLYYNDLSFGTQMISAGKIKETLLWWCNIKKTVFLDSWTFQFYHTNGVTMLQSYEPSTLMQKTCSLFDNFNQTKANHQINGSSFLYEKTKIQFVWNFQLRSNWKFGEYLAPMHGMEIRHQIKFLQLSHFK